MAGEPALPGGFGGGFGGRGPGDNTRDRQRFRGDAGGDPPQARGEGGGPRFGGPGGFFQPAKPIKGFVDARAQSVIDQVAGKSEGQTLGEFGFGGRGGRGGPGGFGPGMFLGNAFMTAFDSDKDGELTRDEFTQGFAKWFDAWNTDKTGVLTDEQLQAGINRDLSPFRGGPPGGPPPRGE